MISAPDYVQKTYSRVLSDGLAGSNADANPTYDASFIAENSDIPFGVAISRGSSFGPPVAARIGTTAVQAASAGYGTGTGTPITAIATWNAITDGEFSLLINGVAFDATGMDFSSATTMDDVAAVIQAKIRSYVAGGAAYTSATVTWSSATFQFTITSGTTGVTSTVTYFDNVDGGYGTQVLITAGLDSALYVAGQAIVAAAVLIGVVIRALTEEGGAGSSSNITVVKEGKLGAYRQDGTIKVLCTEAATAKGTVYIVDATGVIVSSAGGGRTALGTSKFENNYAAGTIGIISVSGLK